MTSQRERVELEERLLEASRAVADLDAHRQAAERSVLAETREDLARSSEGNAALERTVAALVAERDLNTARAHQLRAMGIAAGLVRAVRAVGWTLGLAATARLVSYGGHLAHLAAVATLAGLVVASLPRWRR